MMHGSMNVEFLTTLTEAVSPKRNNLQKWFNPKHEARNVMNEGRGRRGEEIGNTTEIKKTTAKRCKKSVDKIGTL
jgi:hypothetical protein